MWADKVCTGKLSRSLAWKALNHTILKSVEYPLAATCYSETKCNKIMAPALLTALIYREGCPEILYTDPWKDKGLALKI